MLKKVLGWLCEHIAEREDERIQRRHMEQIERIRDAMKLRKLRGH